MSTLGYGGGVLALPDALSGWPWLVGEEPPPLPDPAAALDGALRRPDGAPALDTFVEPGDRVVVVIQAEIPTALRDLCVSRVEEVLNRAGCAEISWLEASGRSNYPAGCEPLNRRGSQEPWVGRESSSPGNPTLSLPRPGAREGAAPANAGAASSGRAARNMAPPSFARLRLAREPSTHPAIEHARPPPSRGRPCRTLEEPGSKPSIDPGLEFEPIGSVRGLGVVRIATPLRRADKLILIGVGSFDPIAGFGGGPQLAARGCAAPATLRALLLQGIEAGAARLQETFGAVLELLPPAFLIQLELQRGDRLAAVFAGDPRRAFAASTAFHRKWHERELAAPLDLVVASAGGAHEDRDLSAALPALVAAASALRPGGGLIFAAACPSGIGSLRDHREASGESLLARVVRGILADRRCWIVSDGLSESETSALGLSLVPDLETGLDVARRAGIPFDRVAILEGSRTMPTIPSNPS